VAAETGDGDDADGSGDGVEAGGKVGVTVGVGVDVGGVVVAVGDSGIRDGDEVAGGMVVVGMVASGVVDCAGAVVQAARPVIALSAANTNRYLAKCRIVRIVIVTSLLCFLPFDIWY
jgi:hypothetical protein